MTLKDKIQIVLDKYNGGNGNYYSKNMIQMIKGNPELDMNENCISEDLIEFSIWELIGICITQNNPDLFNSENKDTYLEITEHCPH